MTMKSFINTVEHFIRPFAIENTEGSYYQAKKMAQGLFALTRLPVTEKQVVHFVNRVWDKTHMEVQ